MEKSKKIKYPICPLCGSKLVGFAKPNEPFTNDRFDFQQKTAELYCTEQTSARCDYRVSFSDLTTPLK